MENLPQSPSEPMLPPAPSLGMIPPAPPHVALPSAPRRGSHRLLFVGMIVAILVVAGGAGAAYYKFVYNPSPDDVVAAALSKLQAAKSLHSTMVLESEIKIPSKLKSESIALPIPGLTSVPDSLKFNITSEGDVDGTDANDIKTSNKVDVYATGAAGSAAIALRFEQHAVGGKGYINFTEIPSFNFLDWTEVKGNWYAYDAGALGKELDSRKQELLAVPDSQAGEDGKKVDPFTKKQIDQVLAILKETKPLRLSKDLGEDKIDGVSMRHYQYAFDENGLRQFMIKYGQALEKPLSDSELADFEKYVTPNLKDMRFDLWIERKTGRLSRVEYNANFNVPLSAWSSGDAESETVNVPVKMVFNFSRYDEAVKIEAPTDAKPVEQLWSAAQQAVMKALFGSMGSSSLGGTISSDDPDADGLIDSLEKQYGTDPNNPDTDGDGLGDYDEIGFIFGDAGRHLDPLKADTDGDGYNDGAELAAGFDPTLKGAKLDARDAKDFAAMKEDAGGYLHEPTVTTLGVKKNEKAIVPIDVKTKADDAKRMSDVKQVAVALEQYYNDNAKYPPGNEVILGSDNAKALCASGFKAACSGGEVIFFSPLPSDSEGSYIYSITDNGNNYTLRFVLRQGTGSYRPGMYTMTNTGISEF